MILCSFFKNNTNTKIHNVKVEDVLMGIKNGRWKDQIEELRSTGNAKLKDLLPAATFSGVFDKERKDSNIKIYSGLITIDIDEKKESKVRNIKKSASEDPFVYACFLSPRGGIKMLIKVDAEAKHHKFSSYEVIKNWVQDNYNVVVDRSGSNMSRLCYVSYDPTLHYNPDSEVFTIEVKEVQEKLVMAPVEVVDWNGRETDINRIYALCKSWVEKKGVSYGRGSRNQYVFQVTCLLNEAGLSADQILYAICSNHSISADMGKEVKDTIEMTCRRKAGSRGKIIIKTNKKQSNFFE
jgi:hypothetical protein